MHSKVPAPGIYVLLLAGKRPSAQLTKFTLTCAQISNGPERHRRRQKSSALMQPNSVPTLHMHPTLQMHCMLLPTTCAVLCQDAIHRSNMQRQSFQQNAQSRLTQLHVDRRPDCRVLVVRAHE